MNWVGGWRSRVMKSSDTRRQKEFFEKKRMQNRHNLLAPPPESPKKASVGNMDLLTMFIVNQIALKKEHNGNPKITHLDKSKGTYKSMGGESLELPMSPCSPSCLNLAESESHYSDQMLSSTKRKHSFLDEFELTLSPLVESNLSDKSASVRQQRVQGSAGSFSSASPSSSEAFVLQTRPTVHISPVTPTESKNAQPVLCEYNPWTVPYQTEAFQTSFADGVQFRGTLHSCESSGPSIHFAENRFKDLEMNDQEEKPHFFGLNSGVEDNSGKRTIKLHLQKETLHSSTRSQLHTSRYVDCRPYRVHRIVSEHACESPVTCSQGERYATSDNVTKSAPSLRYVLEHGKKQDDESYMHMYQSKDILTTSQRCPSGTSVPRRVTSFNQKVMSNREHTEREGKTHRNSKTLRRINHRQDCEEDQFVPSCLQTNTQSGIVHKNTSPRTKDKATQTVGFSSLTSQDASVQCSLLKPNRMRIFTEPTSLIYPCRTHKASATRRQTCHGRERHGNHSAPEIHKVEWNTSWVKPERELTKQGPEIIIGHESLSKSESQECMKKRPLLHCSRTNAPELKEQPSENLVLRGVRQEFNEEESVNQNPTVNSSCTEEHANDFSAESGGDRVSEGKGNLKEIADILLMLKQKNKHP